MAAPKPDIATAAIELPDTAGASPAWIKILPAGAIDAVDGRAWRMDDVAAVLAASRPGLAHFVVDYDHGSDKPGGSSKAAGWLKDLAARDDGLWGLVDWTEPARELLARREYRYLSPVFRHDADGQVTRLLRASLTNVPALHSLPALATQNPAPDERTDPMPDPADAPAALPAALAQALALAADAGLDQALAAIGRLTERAETQAALLSELAQAREALAAVHRAQLDADAERDLDEAVRQGKITPAQRPVMLSIRKSDPEAYQAYLAATPSLLGDPTRAAVRPPSDPAPDPLAEEVRRRFGVPAEAVATARQQTQETR